MSEIFGVLARRDGGLVPDAALSTLRRSVESRADEGVGEWSDAVAALGQGRTFFTPESDLASLPIEHPDAGFVFTAAARVDNREELARELDLTSPIAGLADEQLLMAAYERWGEQTPTRVIGDWSFAAWHPRDRRLFVARDQFGATSLYYVSEPSAFAFACSQHALLALGLVRPQLDELYLGQYLLSWTAYHGERTLGGVVRRLPPAHQLTVTPERLDLRCYWKMEDVVPLRLRRRADYVEGLRAHLQTSVRARLRSTGRVGATLSGGLDSGSVVVTASELLREQGQHLHAFTSVPIVDASAFVGEAIADEFPLASSTAAACGNVDLTAIRSDQISPIGGIRLALEAFGAPVHAAVNMFWIETLVGAARGAGCRVLFTGQLGNAVTSWRGDVLSQPLLYGLLRIGPAALASAAAKRTLPRPVLRARWRWKLDPNWYRLTALRPDFAARLRLLERRLEDPREAPRSPLEERFRMLKPGRSQNGAVGAALGARHGVDVRDPIGDVRLISYMLSVPDAMFIDPRTRTDRWLAREAMRGRLPDAVRLNRRLGVQAADIVPRLRATADEVEGALDELANGPAAAYLDVPYMRETWGTIKRDDTPEAFRNAVTVLTRGMMAGLSVNSLG